MAKTAIAKPVRRKPRPKPGMDPTRAPKWWLTRPAEIRAFLESLKGVAVEEIGRTAGGRPIVAASYGPREDLPGRTSLSLASAVGAGQPRAFFGEGERQRQVLLFLGAAHGNETEGTVAALNYLNIIVTGRDLRGRKFPEMAAEGRKHRHLIVPILNVDGRERFLDHEQFINCGLDYYYMICQGRWKATGEVLHWPVPKRYFPMPLAALDVLGSYFNDAGYNLVYDGPFGADCQPETTALMRYCRRERPDCVILSHSNNGSLVSEPSANIPPAYKQRSTLVGGVVGMRCARDGFPKFAIPANAGSLIGGEFYQSDAIYHVCGALPLLIEFPWGYQNLPDNHDQILDIGLAVIDEVSRFGARYRFRPKIK